MKGAANNEVQHHHHHRHHRHHRHRSQQQQTLCKGSLVEVTSDEEGFKGAWFVATLLKPPSKPSSKRKNPNYDKAYVEYRSLISEGDPTIPLREYVNAAFVRPVPPEETHPKPFELGDIVDAYYKDGWWTGVITRLLQGSRFVVTFQNPPDEIEFGFSDIRFHREWVNGNWIRPVNQKAAGVMFSVGKKVEISFDSECHQESWIPATVLEEIGKGRFRTQYQIQDRGGRVGHMEAIADSLHIHIRPCPPHLKDNNFFLLEKVDAFYDCGWRSGVITKVLADSRYMVFFKQSNREREFSHSDLRPHMEWKDGKWFTSSQDLSIPFDYQNHDGRVCNSTNMSEMAVSLGSSGSKKSTSEDKIIFNLNTGENQVELSTPCNEKPSEVAPDVPSDFVGKEKSTNKIPATIPSPTASPISTNTIEAPSEETISNVVSPKSESVGNNFSKQPLGGDQSSDSHSWGKRVRRKRMQLGELEGNPMSGVKKTNDGFTEVPVEKAHTSIGKEGYAEGAAEDVQKECLTIKTNLPIVLGLACDVMRSSRPKRSCQSAGQESSKHIGDWAGLDETKFFSVKVIDQFELGEKSQKIEMGEKSQKKRRGRPPKSAMKSSIPSMPEEPSKSMAVDELSAIETVEVTASMDTLGFGQECVANGSGKKLMNNQIKQKHKPGIMSTSPLRMPNEEVAEDSIKQHERHPQKRGRKRTMNINTVSQVHESSNATERKLANSDLVRKDLEMATKESSNNMSDDQPLSKWFEEMHPPTTHDGTRVSPPRNVEQCAEASSEQLEIVKGTPAVDNKNGTAGSELQCLPFIKNTILWSTIESMEVFRRMPQKPHFRPLEQCKESSREGLAIGCMVTFSSVVERTSRLQFDDPKSTMDDISETLVELESHGFDIRVVRDRVTTLLSGKEKQENLQSQIEQLDSEIGNHNLEKTKIDEEIDEITRQIKDLQGKLSEAMSKKENKDREIASLQSKLEGIKDGIRSVQCDFEGLATLL